jgi:hypothetical protein
MLACFKSRIRNGDLSMSLPEREQEFDVTRPVKRYGQGQRLGRLFRQRCVYLFLALIVLIIAEPFLLGDGRGRIALVLIHALVLVTACAALSGGSRLFPIAVALAVSLASVQVYSALGGDPLTPWFRWIVSTLLYAVVLGALFAYVLRREVMTTDKLWGGAAAFLLIGILWAGFYEVAQYIAPASFVLQGQGAELNLTNRIYFSFTVLTSTGFGDIAPVSDIAKTLCVLEQITGVLFLTIMIARLAGIYLPGAERSE